MPVSDTIEKGQKIYYPSVKGIALVCEVLDESEDDFLVDIDGRRYFLPKVSVDSHGIVMNAERSKMYVSQRLEDPENTIVYMRYRWDETLVDRMYNSYCEKRGRYDKTIFPKGDYTPAVGNPDVDI